MGIDIRHFGPTSAAEEALRKIDDSTGARTREAFIHTWVRFPHLSKVVVKRNDIVMPAFHPTNRDLATTTLVMNGNPDFYSRFTGDGPFASRIEGFNDFFRSRGITPGIPEIMTALMVHELGHGDDLHGYIRKAGFDTRAAFEMAHRVRMSDFATLPLGTATSNADAAWQNNTNGYRDRLQAQGWTDERWAATRLANIEAYTRLPSEAVADRFALGVLATMYPDQGQADVLTVGTSNVYEPAWGGSEYNQA